MRRAWALFDAPIPAARALAGLEAAGVDPADVWTVPALPWPGGAMTQPLAPETDLPELRRALLGRDLSAHRLDLVVDAVRRGVILVMVETPTLSAGRVTEILNGAGPADPDELATRWAAQRATTYDWRALAAPEVDPPEVRPR